MVPFLFVTPLNIQSPTLHIKSIIWILLYLIRQWTNWPLTCPRHPLFLPYFLSYFTFSFPVHPLQRNNTYNFNSQSYWCWKFGRMIISSLLLKVYTMQIVFVKVPTEINCCYDQDSDLEKVQPDGSTLPLNSWTISNVYLIFTGDHCFAQFGYKWEVILKVFTIDFILVWKLKNHSGN